MASAATSTATGIRDPYPSPPPEPKKTSLAGPRERVTALMRATLARTTQNLKPGELQLLPDRIEAMVIVGEIATHFYLVIQVKDGRMVPSTRHDKAQFDAQKFELKQTAAVSQIRHFLSLHLLSWEQCDLGAVKSDVRCLLGPSVQRKEATDQSAVNE